MSTIKYKLRGLAERGLVYRETVERVEPE